MTEATFSRIFSQFLEKYWGAFHEALEAQSVTQRRLAGSLLQALRAQHDAFEKVYAGSAKSALDELGDLWRDLEARSHQWPDPALTRDDVIEAKRLFVDIYDDLIEQGRKFSAAQKELVEQAPHGTPRDLLRADAAR